MLEYIAENTNLSTETQLVFKELIFEYFTAMGRIK